MRGKDIKRYIFVLIVVLLFLAFKAGLFDFLSGDNIEILLNDHVILAPFIFMFIYIIITPLFFPATPLSIVGGAFFGPIIGGVYVLFAATVGATLSFLSSRYFLNEWVEEKIISKNKKLKEYNDKLGVEKGTSILLILRMLPIVPFNLLNYSLGLTNIKLSQYIWTTLVGIIPGVLVYTFFGDFITKLF